MEIRAYGDLVANMSLDELKVEIARPQKLSFFSGHSSSGKKRVEMAWAPFDHINKNARVAVFGITPGREQMESSLKAYRLARTEGQEHKQAAIQGKATGAFAGDIGKTLVQILDEVAIPSYLDITSSRSLWNVDANKVHFSSALRWPVFVEVRKEGGKTTMENYTGYNPAITSLPIFHSILQNILAKEIEKLPNDCIIAPLGRASMKALSLACKHIKGFDTDRLLLGLPHPSGSARDHSSQFLGVSPRKGRTKPLNPQYRADAHRLRAQVLDLIP